MSVKSVKRNLWVCDVCGDTELVDGEEFPGNWETLFTWGVRKIDERYITDLAVHVCGACDSGKMFFAVRRLIEHLTGDKARQFRGERCSAIDGYDCQLPVGHDGRCVSNKNVAHNRVLAAAKESAKAFDEICSEPVLSKARILNAQDTDPADDDDIESHNMQCSRRLSSNGEAIYACHKLRGHHGLHHDLIKGQTWSDDVGVSSAKKPNQSGEES